MEIDLPQDLFPGSVETVNGCKRKIVMPNYLKSAASLTLPMRLEVLGDIGFGILAHVMPLSIGNTVLGFGVPYAITHNAIVDLFNRIKSCNWNVNNHLVILPFVSSKGMARVSLWFKMVLVAFLVLTIIKLIYNTNISVSELGWIAGFVSISLVLFSMANQRIATDGDMVFCRSLGCPEIEEFMFSYSWKKEESNIRTIAKALWNSGVGVWIDVLKLNPGDEIRSVVRTVVRDVRYCVVFISAAYINSANCCLELAEAVSNPSKLWVCYLEDMSPAVIDYFSNLKPYKTCFGIRELVSLLDETLTSTDDPGAYQWWCTKPISSINVPVSLCLGNRPSWERIPKYSLYGDIFIPLGSLSCGPLYISPNCNVSGNSICYPWYFIGSCISMSLTMWWIVLQYEFTPTLTKTLTWCWFIVMCCYNLVPFFATNILFDTRIFTDKVLRPLLSSKSILGGVQVEIFGEELDPMVISLKSFLKNLGHLYEKNTNTQLATVKVYIMSTLEHRDALFSASSFSAVDLNRSLFIWKDIDKSSDFINPFTNDDIGFRMMSVLCLVERWENNLASALFAAIAIRVSSCLHSVGSLERLRSQRNQV